MSSTEIKLLYPNNTEVTVKRLESGKISVIFTVTTTVMEYPDKERKNVERFEMIFTQTEWDQFSSAVDSLPYV